MRRLSCLIRYDKEFAASLETLRLQMKADAPDPIIINGLTRGASSAYLVEAIREVRTLSGAPVLVIVSSESERERCTSGLCAEGINALEYKTRELVFHNVSASHDTERERLSVLSAVMNGTADAVVTTPSAAISYTVPEELLMKLTMSLKSESHKSVAKLLG